MSQARLFVGNLAYQTGENDLQDYFAQVGVVKSVNLMMDRVTGKSRGFAFVELSSPEEAQKAIEQFHNKDFQGQGHYCQCGTPPRRARPPRRDRPDFTAVVAAAIVASAASGIKPLLIFKPAG